ncbi:choice-of-anchor A family protein [Anabaena azotica]|uniref:choice-of-anchor A family protein n=1 Tax=Anabaena azotica TaxID=197653 RepID=UPI0039A4DCF1
MPSKTYFNWGRIAVPVFATLALSYSAKANAATLGIASEYNVFVIGNISQQYTDIEGKLAAGGNVSLIGSSVGDKLPNNSGNVVVAGNNLTLSNGQVNHGNAVYGGTANVSNNVGFPNGTLSQGNPIDFNAAKVELLSLSQYLAGLNPTGQTTVQYGGINLTGSGTALNVFNLAGSSVSSANSFDINGDQNSTVVVNISGTNVSLQNFGFNIQGTNRQKIIYNFYEATNLTASGIGIEGTILAPLANFNFNNGQINGNVVVSSLTGNGESHNYLFNGNLPDVPKTPIPASVPEPANLAGLGLVAAMFCLFQCKYKKTIQG